MKIVIGYDGSEHADAALDDLRWAGLPRDAEALIISITEAAMSPLSVSRIAENGLDPERIASAVTYTSKTMMRDDLRRVPVTHDGKLVGVISRADIIHLLAPS